MGWITATEHYTRKVHDPDTREEALVTFRALNAGDRAEIGSEAARYVAVADDAGEAGMEASVDMSRFQMLALLRAIVSWELPIPFTEATLKQLHPDVFTELWGHVSFGSVPADPELEDEPDPTNGAADGATIENG